MAASSSSACSTPTATGRTCAEAAMQRLRQQLNIRGHEVAIAELNSLPPTHPVYQRNVNLFFRTTVQEAIASQQNLLQLATGSVLTLTDDKHPGDVTGPPP